MISLSLPFNDTLKGRLATERDMNTLEERASSNIIKFNKDKGNVWQTRRTKLCNRACWELPAWATALLKTGWGCWWRAS